MLWLGSESKSDSRVQNFTPFILIFGIFKWGVALMAAGNSDINGAGYLEPCVKKDSEALFVLSEKE